jgi:hypothetical protein
MAGEAIMSIAYGIDVLPKDDPYIATAEKGVHPLGVAAIPGTFLVDTFPWLKYVPNWMPFAGFKRKAKEWRKLALAMIEVPFEAGKQKIVSTITHESIFLHHSVASQESGNVTPSFLSYSLERMNENHDLAYQKEVIRNIAGAMYAGIHFLFLRTDRSYAYSLVGSFVQVVLIRYVLLIFTLKSISISCT